MYKSVKNFLVILLMTALIPKLAQGALVEVSILGSTDTLTFGNDLSYIPGGTFSASFIYDTNFADRNPATDVGEFNDFSGNTALISFSVSTNIGTVEFISENVTDPVFPCCVGAGVRQFQLPARSGQSVVTNFGSVRSTTNDGYTGSLIDTNGLIIEPNSFIFNLGGIGSNNYFFTDPNILFSGVSELSIDAETLGGTMELSNTTNNIVRTRLTFGASGFNIREISAVPIPAAIWLFGSGLIALVGISKRKMIKLK